MLFYQLKRKTYVTQLKASKFLRTLTKKHICHFPLAYKHLLTGKCYFWTTKWQDPVNSFEFTLWQHCRSRTRKTPLRRGKSEKLNKQRMTVKWNCFLPPIFLPWIHSLDRHVVLFTYENTEICIFRSFLVQFGIKLSIGWTATNPFHCSFQKICPLIIQWS